MDNLGALIARSEMLLELERAAVVASWRKPDSVVTEREGWFQITTPSSKGRWHNRVVESVMSREEAPVRIAQVIAEYRALGADFSWRVGPNAAPAELGALLAGHGMVPSELVGMAVPVARLDVRVEAPITVERVALENVEDYVRASAAGWNNDVATAAALLADMQRALADPASPCLFYLARYRGEAAGAGALWPVSARSAYLLGSSVAPAFRSRGVYRALVAARASALRALGIPLATIWAFATSSAPICERLGFDRVCTAQLFTWPA